MGIVKTVLDLRVRQGAKLNQTIGAIARNIGMIYNESNSDSMPYCDTSFISELYNTDYKNYLNYKLLISL